MSLPSSSPSPQRELEVRNRLPVRSARVAVLALTDAVALFAAGALAYLLWARPVHRQPVSLYLDLLPLLGIFLAGYASAGLYPGFGLGPVETLRRLVTRTAFGFLLLAALSFASKSPYLYSRMTFGLTFVLSLPLLPLARLALDRLVGGRGWWPEPVVLIGARHSLGRTLGLLGGAARMGYRPVGVLVVDGAEEAADEPVPVLGNLEQAPAVARGGVRVALLEPAGEWLSGPTLDGLRQHFRHLVVLRQIEDLPVEGVQIRNLGGGVLGLEYTNNLLQRRNRLMKRSLDLVAGCAALLLALPVIALAALAVRLISPGPAFFGQRREGLHGDQITVWKVRTMHVDAERRLQQVLAEDPELRRQWQERYKLSHDPRVIPWIGRFLRRFSLDELPQLYSVLRGDMSLVGPRPFPDYHLERFSPSFRQLRRRVRPGITGIWQVTVRSDGSIEEQEALDSYYIRNWSLWLDLFLLARTLSAVLQGRGAY